MAALDRTHCPGHLFAGLIQGFGLKSGALACSAARDTSDIIIFDANDADMALAVNRISELQGGAVLCDRAKEINEKANARGVPFPDNDY